MMERREGNKTAHCASHSTSSKVTLLQYQLQELSERERSSRNHNQKLLQDFQRAEDTLCDMVARTEAMNTIRMEYEQYLQENYPKWRQKLRENRLSEQRKIIERHQKACTSQMDEEAQRTDRGSKHPLRIHSPSATSPVPSYSSIFNSFLHLSDHMGNVAEGSQQNMQGNIYSSYPSMRLMQLHHPVTERDHNNISKNATNIQNVHKALTSLLDPNPLSGDPVHSHYSVVTQESPSYEHLRQYPNSWAHWSRDLRVQCPTDCPSWSHLPLIRGHEERREEMRREKMRDSSSKSQDKNHYLRKQRKKMISSDAKPACPNHHRDTSESSNLSSEGVESHPTEGQRAINGTREEKQTYSTRKDFVSQESSSISDSRSVPNHQKHKRNQQSNERQNGFKTSKVAIDSPEHLRKESEDDGNSIDGTHTSISQVMTEEIQRYEKKNNTDEETKILSTGVNEMANGYLTDNQEKRASLCEVRDQEEEEEKEPCSKEQSSTDEEEAQDEEASRSNTSFKEALVKEERESEVEEEEDREKGDENEKSRAGRKHKEHDNESDQDRNYDEVLPLGSERNRFTVLYKVEPEDRTEKETNMEEEEEEEDKEDDVIVEKASPWPYHVSDDKYQDDNIDDDDYDDDDEDDDDDIEGLLAPKNNIHQAHKEEEILKSKGVHKDSEEKTQGKDEDSGDEFDHFYD